MQVIDTVFQHNAQRTTHNVIHLRRRIQKQFYFILILITISVLFKPNFAFALMNGSTTTYHYTKVVNGMGSGNQIYTPNAQSKLYLQQKEKLAQLLLLVRQGKISMAKFITLLHQFYQQHGVNPSYLQNTNFAQNVSSAIGINSILGAVYQIPQQKTYYCGPASAETVLKYLGKDTPQSVLASSQYLQTDQNGGTNYGSNLMATTINILGQTGNFYAQKNDSNIATYETDMTTDILTSWPIVIAAHESAAYNLNISEIGWYHWFVVRGYTNYGANSSYVDPASGIWNVPAYGTVTSSTIVGTMQGFGYVW